MPLALDQNVATIVWSPLGWARLTGKIRRNQPMPTVSRLHKAADPGTALSARRPWIFRPKPDHFSADRPATCTANVGPHITH